MTLSLLAQNLPTLQNIVTIDIYINIKYQKTQKNWESLIDPETDWLAFTLKIQI